MNIKVLNESLSRHLYESGLTDQELIDKMKNLKGQYFAGSLKDNTAEIDSSNLPKNIFGNYLANFENFKEDGFSLEDLKEYSHFIRDRKPLEGVGYDFADWIHKDYQDDEIEEIYPDDNGKYWLFLNLEIKPQEFGGDFDKLSKEIDEYLLGYKEKYDEIKARVSDEQKKSVKKLTKKAADLTKAIPEIFKNGEVVSKEQTSHHYHATFSSNSTSEGLYVVEYPNKGLTKKDIMGRYFYDVQSAIKDVPKPKAGMYSTIYGARKDYLMDRIKKGEFSVTRKVIRFEDLPYEDVFIGD